MTVYTSSLPSPHSEETRQPHRRSQQWATRSPSSPLLKAQGSRTRIRLLLHRAKPWSCPGLVNHCFLFQRPTLFHALTKLDHTRIWNQILSSHPLFRRQLVFPLLFRQLSHPSPWKIDQPWPR
jgi:hypothetical protein